MRHQCLSCTNIWTHSHRMSMWYVYYCDECSKLFKEKLSKVKKEMEDRKIKFINNT